MLCSATVQWASVAGGAGEGREPSNTEATGSMGGEVREGEDTLISSQGRGTADTTRCSMDGADRRVADA